MIHEKKREGSRSYCYYHLLLSPTQLEPGHYHHFCSLPTTDHAPFLSQTRPPKLALRPHSGHSDVSHKKLPELKTGMLSPIHPSMPSARLPLTRALRVRTEKVYAHRLSGSLFATLLEEAAYTSLHLPVPTSPAIRYQESLTRLRRQGGERARRAHVGTCW